VDVLIRAGALSVSVLGWRWQGGKDVDHLVGMCMVVSSFLFCRDVLSVACSSSVRDAVMFYSPPARFVL